MGTATAPRLLLIDNYDSFTYNLVQAFLVLGAEVLVHRNDAITVEQAQALAPSHLCISPGPGTPHDAGVSMDMIRAFAGRVPVLGEMHRCDGASACACSTVIASLRCTSTSAPSTRNACTRL